MSKAKTTYVGSTIYIIHNQQNIHVIVPLYYRSNNHLSTPARTCQEPEIIRHPDPEKVPFTGVQQP